MISTDQIENDNEIKAETEPNIDATSPPMTSEGDLSSVIKNEPPTRKKVRLRVVLVSLVVSILISLITLGSWIGYWYYQKSPVEATSQSQPSYIPKITEEDKHNFLLILDKRIENYFNSTLMFDIEKYKIGAGSYKGYSISDPLKIELQEICVSTSHVDVSPGGEEYVVHQPLCTEPEKSLCYDNTYRSLVRKETKFIEENFRCF